MVSFVFVHLLFIESTELFREPLTTHRPHRNHDLPNRPGILKKRSPAPLRPPSYLLHVRCLYYVKNMS